MVGSRTTGEVRLDCTEVFIASCGTSNRNTTGIIVERIENCTYTTGRSPEPHSAIPGSCAPPFDGHNWKECVSFPGSAGFDVARVGIEGSLAVGCNSDAGFNASHYNRSSIGGQR